MGAFLTAFNAVLPLFLIILAGLLFSRTRAASSYWIDVLNKYALWIGFPALVINSLSQLDLEGGPILQLILINSAYIVACILLAYPVSRLLKLSNLQRRTLFLIFAFGNVAYLGMPVLQNMMGEQILPVAAILSAVYVFWLLILALVLVEVHAEEGQLHISKLMASLVKNPLLLSVLVGVLILAFNIRLPAALAKTISMFSGSVTPIVLFSLGIFMGYQSRGTLRDWAFTGVFVVITMILFPALFHLSIRGSNMPADYIKASILDAAMPLGLTPYALSQQYHLDTPFAARTVVLATLVSVVILPIWSLILG
ncbi:predicted permease [Bacteroidales bacterium 6E]|nr:predicted permease [Bacteroidales bacterium 6E]